jgi:hypothetical protein
MLFLNTTFQHRGQLKPVNLPYPEPVHTIALDSRFRDNSHYYAIITRTTWITSVRMHKTKLHVTCIFVMECLSLLVIQINDLPYPCTVTANNKVFFFLNRPWKFQFQILFLEDPF